MDAEMRRYTLQSSSEAGLLTSSSQHNLIAKKQQPRIANDSRIHTRGMALCILFAQLESIRAVRRSNAAPLDCFNPCTLSPT